MPFRFFSPQCFEIIIFLSKATSTDAVAALEEVSVWWTVVVFTQQSATFKIEITQPSTGLWYLKQDNQPHLESMFLKEIAVRELLFESTIQFLNFSVLMNIQIPMKVFILILWTKKGMQGSGSLWIFCGDNSSFFTFFKLFQKKSYKRHFMSLFNAVVKIF